MVERRQKSERVSHLTNIRIITRQPIRFNDSSPFKLSRRYFENLNFPRLSTA